MLITQYLHLYCQFITNLIPVVETDKNIAIFTFTIQYIYIVSWKTAMLRVYTLYIQCSFIPMYIQRHRVYEKNTVTVNRFC